MLDTMPNRIEGVPVRVRIQTPYKGACPVSGQPGAGSWVAVEYEPRTAILDFRAIAKHLPTYADEARDVEAIVQLLARDCATALGAPVVVSAYYILPDGITLEARSECA